MADAALQPGNNLQHNVLTRRTRDPQVSLMALAEQYVRTQVAGQAEGTIDAKQRDLACFLTFYEKVPASVALWPEFVAHNVAAQHKAYELACAPASLRLPQYDVAREVVRVRDEAVCECIYIPVVQTQM